MQNANQQEPENHIHKMTIQLSRDSYLVIYQGFMCFVAVKLPLFYMLVSHVPVMCSQTSEHGNLYYRIREQFWRALRCIVVNLKARHYEICALSCLFACSQVLLMDCMTMQLYCHPEHQRRICYNFLSKFTA